MLDLIIADADGNITYASEGLPAAVNVRDREYFRLHRQGGADRLHISKPVLGRVVDTWIILLSRPIYRQGRFAGVVAASMSPVYLSRQLNTLALAPRDVIALLHTDGGFVARSHSLEKALGNKAPHNRPFLDTNAPSKGL